MSSEVIESHQPLLDIVLQVYWVQLTKVAISSLRQ